LRPGVGGLTAPGRVAWVAHAAGRWDAGVGHVSGAAWCRRRPGPGWSGAPPGLGVDAVVDVLKGAVDEGAGIRARGTSVL
jgi:hypothetical protein